MIDQKAPWYLQEIEKKPLEIPQPQLKEHKLRSQTLIITIIQLNGPLVDI